MTSAVESFVVALSRASKKANRYLARLQSADRDDIIAMALAWCWEHRSEYPLDVPLDQWFTGAIRNAKQEFFAAEERAQASSVLAPMQADLGDDPSIQAEAIQAAGLLADALAPEESRVASLIAAGYTHRQIVHKVGSGADALITRARKQLKRFSVLLPRPSDQSQVLRDARARTAPASGADDVRYKAASIDRAIEQLDFPPPEMADCPPCWRCKYFEGYLPGDHRSVRLIVSEAEVREAVSSTEVRKVDIATRVRDGEVGFTGIGREA